MSYNKLKEYQIILASASPRRQQFFREMELDFKVHPIHADEVYPDYLKGAEISDYLAKLKAAGYSKELGAKDILITSDTVVWHNNISLAKPADSEEALSMLGTLSNDWHEVITSVCFTTTDRQQIVNHCTKVKFKELTLGEMEYYIRNFNPFDKAGGYGIQDWIGLIGIEEIQGSYTNVVGLPTQLVYKTLMTMVG
ncbi:MULTISPECIES: Maf family protein [unclassified Arenibacter]|jgi:septum formation protein|uniref:Maf family protein n=1 Tax=unclassified Arenibacter TaxID=2615047 RepID=UPI000E35412E|nr:MULTISPECIES: Maf family protein [unclassified Arenibacter]MCM4162842.1 septum formation inhibitor Maf [Arenibacter sp. A80]RFT56895.1 septum formation inhibitor Maf [Arenibacter sp. P308M17]